MSQLAPHEPGDVLALVQQFRRMLSEYEHADPVLKSSFSTFGARVQTAAVVAQPHLHRAATALAELVVALEASAAYRTVRRTRTRARAT